jgi:ubiquitin carboxyl-terminal hydrolase 9/24
MLSSLNRSIRLSSLEQFSLIATKCCLNHETLINFIELLYSHLNTTVTEKYLTSYEFFQLFCRLLEAAGNLKCSVPLVGELLQFEIDLIQNVKVSHAPCLFLSRLTYLVSQQKLVKDGLIEEIQLEGHLGLTKEVIAMLDSDHKLMIGCDPEGRWSKSSKSRGLIKLLIDEFIFPASRSMVLLQKHPGKNVPIEEINPICSSPGTLSAAFEVLVVLCTSCFRNLEVVVRTIIEMFYSGEGDNTEWEYLPPVGPRPSRGFVGLKNAGATCYMNSVLQQVRALSLFCRY